MAQRWQLEKYFGQMKMSDSDIAKWSGDKTLMNGSNLH